MSTFSHHYGLKLVVALVLSALFLSGTAVRAEWSLGRGSDSSGTSYLAIVNDSADGTRLELDCAPSGQAFLALIWRSDVDSVTEVPWSLRFVIDGSHRFAAQARLRIPERGLSALELVSSDIIAPLTEILVLSGGELEVDAVQQGTSIVHAVFHGDGAGESIARYRSYCRF